MLLAKLKNHQALFISAYSVIIKSCSRLHVYCSDWQEKGAMFAGFA